MTKRNRPTITLIVAAALDNAIGVGNELPWHLPSDLAFFKAQTLDKPIVMGRKTWESIGRPLPKRTNVVISRQSREALSLPEDVLSFASLEQALEALASEPEVMIIGGAQLFAESLPIADKLILNRIQTTVPAADVFFPEIPRKQWQLESEHAVPVDEKNQHAQNRQNWMRKR